MKVLVLGAQGLLGRAIVDEMKAAGHQVTTAARRGADLALDFRFDLQPEMLRPLVRGQHIVVNAIGILMERDGNTWDAVHRRATEALCSACEAERVARIVHISALGVGTGLPGGYMASKLAAETALASHGVDYAIVRPGLLVDEASPSTRLFRALASLPVIALPGLWHPGASQVAPIAVTDVARCVTRIAAHPKALRRVIELSGPQTLSYRAMLAACRHAQGRGRALWLPLPWWLMKLMAWPARWLPQTVFSLDTLRMLQAGSVSGRSETMRWLGRHATPVFPTGSVDPATARAATA
ncbi:MAG: NAD(P)H-binding protein [Ramlibacter sp.]|nr:NAD(P)H-binding protein [Ramlibacter sp.]